MNTIGYFPHERQLLQNLKASGFSPRVIYDIGASTGIWSEEMSGMLPHVEYHLFEPLADFIAEYKTDLPGRLVRCPNLTMHPIALSDANGTAKMYVTHNGYCSSLNNTGDLSEIETTITVPTRRLDDYVSEHDLPPPDVIKMDTQGMEGSILRGSLRAVKEAKVLIIESWFKRAYGPSTPLLQELIQFLEEHSFSLVDLGERFYDETHRLYSVDAFFVAESLEAASWRAEKISVPSSSPIEVQDLIARLESLIAPTLYETPFDMERRSRPEKRMKDADAVISHIEVNDKHGVGVLLRRLFPDQQNIISVRSANHYNGEQQFGARSFCLSHTNHSRDAVFSKVLKAFGSSTVRRILCAPYYPDDVRTAIAVKEAFGAPLCTYLMDDQNVCVDEIPDDLMRELLAKSSLRLAISPEMRLAYEEKYGYPISYLPPVAPAHLIPSQLQVPSASAPLKHGVILGNIWGQRWLELLRRTVRNSGVTLSWYSNNEPDADCASEDLIAGSIRTFTAVRDGDLVKALRETRFAVLPCGTLDDADDRWFIAKLSLPSRLIFLLATSHIPVIVLGHSETPAARFVREFGIGLTADYNRQSFLDAVHQITQTDVNLAMRKRAQAVASRFSDADVGEWIWQSLDRGEPIDRRFSDLLPQDGESTLPYTPQAVRSFH